MNTLNNTPKEKPEEHKPSEEIQESIYPDIHETNIADGGEFLDDGIRMKEQPFGYSSTEEEE